MLKFPFQSTRARALFFLTVGLLFYALGKWQIAHSNDGDALTIGSKNFTESRILGEMYALALEKNGFHVQRKFNLGGTLIAQAALKKGEIDLYPEYTGTGLIDVLGISPKRHPETQNLTQTLKILNDEYEQRWRLHWLDPTEANDSQGLVVRQDIAEKYHLRTISRLAQVAPLLRLATIPEFEDRPDGLPGLQKAYPGLHFKRIQQYDNGLKYRVLHSRNADVTVAFTTDGELTDRDLILLKDDRNFWPEYRVAPVVREATLQTHPSLAGILNEVSRQLDTATLRQLNADVELHHEDYQTVARQFLKTRRLL